MSIVVQKYGGSSVADVEKIRTVARRVVATRDAGHRVVCVVSAMGNTTNELLALARSVSPNPGRRELDMLISVGERVAMTLLSMAISDLGAPARSFTGSQSGIITDEAHTSARIVAVRPTRLRAALEADEVVIVAGFQGVSRDKEVTTLGRGGTDLTAVALAAALGAEWCEICSDVDGVYSADPRTVPAARKLDTLSLDEALALARSGARVLQADAVALAHRMGIELQASATAEPPGRGSRIVVKALPPRFTGVTVDRQLERFRGPAGLLDALVAAGAEVRRASPGCIIVDRRNWHDRASFTLPAGAHAEELVEVAATSGGPRVEGAALVRLLEALHREGIEVLDWSAGPEALRVVVSSESAAKAEKLVHLLLVEELADAAGES